MKSINVVAIATLTACLATQASAQSTALAPTAKATPEQIAAATAEADRLIANAKAQAYFVNATKDGLPRVRHIASGMECVFDPGRAENQIVVYASSAAPGDDVSCQTSTVYADGGWVIDTIYASRYPKPLTLDQQMTGMVQALKDRVSNPQPSTIVSANLSSAPPHSAARFQTSHGGSEQFFERAAAGVVGDWDISQRITAPLAQAQEADLLGELILARALEDVGRASKRP